MGKFQEHFVFFPNFPHFLIFLHFYLKIGELFAHFEKKMGKFWENTTFSRNFLAIFPSASHQVDIKPNS